MKTHKLDEAVEDILLHYGVKGMRWGKKKTSAEIERDREAAIATKNAIGGALSDASRKVRGTTKVSKELGDVINVAFGAKGNLKKEVKDLKYAVKTKLNKINKEVKKRGERMLTRMFGKSKQRSRTLVMTKDGYRWKEYKK